MFRNKQLSVIVLVLTLTFIVGIACTPQEKPVPRNNDTGMGDTTMEEREDRIEERDDKNLNDRDTDRDIEANDKAARLAEMIADKTPNVNSATVVFAEEIVYVGIDLEANVSGEKARDLKKQIAKMVKQQDPDVETVYVTEDADTLTRLQKVARDIENGRPISGFLDELENIFKRVTPSMD